MTYNAKAQAKYDKKCVHIGAKLFPVTDQDIIQYLEQTDEPTATLIKRLIRDEISRQSFAQRVKEK